MLQIGKLEDVVHGITELFGRLEERIESIDDTRVLFSQWVGKFGALERKTSKASLEHRIRHAPGIRVRILDLLNELVGDLEELQSQLTGDISGQRLESKFSETEDALELMSEPTGCAVSDSCQQSEILSSIKDTIGRLFEHTLAAIKAGRQDPFHKAEAVLGRCVNNKDDMLYIGEKFPRIQNDPALWRKLALANVKRREFFIYWQSQENVAATVSTSGNVRCLQEDGHAPAHTWLKSVTSKPSNVLSTAAAITPPGLDDTASISTLATDMRTNSLSSRLFVPPLEDFAASGEQFECPYCRETQRFKSQKGWIKHVFKDLRPYICTFPSCEVLFFDNGRDWSDHEEKEHRRIRYCQFCPCDSFQAVEDLEQHFDERHNSNALGLNDTSALKSCSSPPEYIPASECQFCDCCANSKSTNVHSTPKETSTMPVDEFMEHLSDHLEQIALFALPQLNQHERGSAMQKRKFRTNERKEEGDEQRVPKRR